MEINISSDFQRSFLNWIIQEEQDLQELNHAMSQCWNDESKLISLVAKVIRHTENHTQCRINLARHDVLILINPPWNTVYENSFMWIGGFRPSMLIRLAYTLCGIQIESQLAEYLQGIRRGNLGELTSSQLVQIDQLHGKTIREEGILESRMANLQEDVADNPLTFMASLQATEREVSRTLDHQTERLAGIFQDADKLRLSTLKGLLNILTPLQAVEHLAAAKQLHLRIRDWCKRRYHLQPEKEAK